MDDWKFWLNLAVSLLSILIALPALVLAVLAYRDGRRVREELSGSLGDPVVQLSWGTPDTERRLKAFLQVKTSKIADGSLTLGRQRQSLGDIDPGGSAIAVEVEFAAEGEGAPFLLQFTDPITRKKRRFPGVLRYGKGDLYG